MLALEGRAISCLLVIEESSGGVPQELKGIEIDLDILYLIV